MDRRVARRRSAVTVCPSPPRRLDHRAGRQNGSPRFASTASIAIRLAAARQVSRSNELLAATAHAFARKLTQLSGDRALYQCIVDTAAQMTNARLAGLSMYQPQEGALAMAATYGYPSESVGHVRIVPGSGIIGGVFA